MTVTTDLHAPSAIPPDADPASRAADGGLTTAPIIDVVVPVYNEGRVLARSIHRLCTYLGAGFPFTWRITIVDNASTDDTWELAVGLSDSLPDVRAVHLDRRGRGLALRTAWMASDAQVVAYMDVDLSTGLEALLPLVAPLVSGHSDVAVGSRLAAAANVARGPKREAISRAYNVILRTLFANRFRDAQCGFKAIRSDVARRIVPEVKDDKWFFDTELLLLAEHNGLRIHEVPVDWLDDPDSRVNVVKTATDDLKGAARMFWRFATGRGLVDLGPLDRRRWDDDMGRHLVGFAIVGILSTAISLLLFLGLRSSLGSIGAVVVALAATATANSWAHRRLSFRRRGRDGLRRHVLASASIAVASIAVSVLVLVLVDAAGGGLWAELFGLVFTWSAAAAARFTWLGRSPDVDARRPV